LEAFENQILKRRASTLLLKYYMRVKHRYNEEQLIRSIKVDKHIKGIK